MTHPLHGQKVFPVDEGKTIRETMEDERQKLDAKGAESPFFGLVFPAIYCFACKTQAMAIKVEEVEGRDCKCSNCGDRFGNLTIGEDGRLVQLKYDDLLLIATRNLNRA